MGKAGEVLAVELLLRVRVEGSFDHTLGVCEDF
jgi:hypothetical protein